MLKYVDYDIVFREVPDEVTLALNLSGCPVGCPGCHSPYLMRDTGRFLTAEAIAKLMDEYRHEITCLCFMGGDADPHAVALLARETRCRYPEIQTAWYSGRDALPEDFDTAAFHYIKLGPYRAEFGPLDCPTTNQRFYHVRTDGSLEDQTDRFWRQADCRKPFKNRKG